MKTAVYWSTEYRPIMGSELDPEHQDDKKCNETTKLGDKTMTDETNGIEASDAVDGRSEFALLCGEIQLGFLFDDYSTIKLRQENGYRIDLICRFTEIADSFGGKLAVKYWITDKPTTYEDAQTGFVRKLFGDVSAGCEANEYSYSELTFGVDYDSELKVGGHDLFNEIAPEAGKFIWLLVEKPAT